MEGLAKLFYVDDDIKKKTLLNKNTSVGSKNLVCLTHVFLDAPHWEFTSQNIVFFVWFQSILPLVAPVVFVFMNI